MRSRGRPGAIRTLDPADDLPAGRALRIARLRRRVRSRRYRPPTEEVAEAILAWVGVPEPGRTTLAASG